MSTIWKIIGLIGMLIIISITGGIGKEVSRYALNGDGNKSIEAALRHSSEKLNQQLPFVVDKQTRLDTTVAGPGKKWTYLYTVTNIKLSGISQAHLQKEFGSSIRNSVCTSKDMKIFIENGVQIVYRYRHYNGDMIGDIVINPNDCR